MPSQRSDAEEFDVRPTRPVAAKRCRTTPDEIGGGVRFLGLTRRL
jgi:hypothetical protein